MINLNINVYLGSDCKRIESTYIYIWLNRFCLDWSFKFFFWYSSLRDDIGYIRVFEPEVEEGRKGENSNSWSWNWKSTHLSLEKYPDCPQIIILKIK